MIGKFPRIIIGNTNIVHKVLDGDANEEEENELIDRVSETYFKLWKFTTELYQYNYAICSVRENWSNLAETY